MLEIPQHNFEEVLDGIEWKAGVLEQLKEAAADTGNDEMVNNLEVLEQIFEYYEMNITDVFKGREHYQMILPWAHMYLLEEILAEIVIWLFPEEVPEMVDSRWLERRNNGG